MLKAGRALFCIQEFAEANLISSLMSDYHGSLLTTIDEAPPPRKEAAISSKGLSSTEAFDLLRIHGRNELKNVKTPKWLIFLQQFWAPMPIMIWLAAIVEVAIENYPDFGILLGIQFINAGLGFYEIVKVMHARLDGRPFF